MNDFPPSTQHDAEQEGLILDMLDRPESDNPALADLLSRRPVWAMK